MIEILPVAAGEVDQFTIHFQPDITKEMVIDYLSSIGRSAKPHRVSDRGRSGAIEQTASPSG
jgi:hypothetical protein